MRCQQRAKRRCPRGSSDVREADRALPADASAPPREPADSLNRGAMNFQFGLDDQPCESLGQGTRISG